MERNPAWIGRLIRVELITGDTRQGRYVGHDSRYLYLHDGVRREIDLKSIKDVGEPRLEMCLRAE